MSLLKLRTALKKDDHGISLAELLVGFFVSLLLLTMVGGFFAAVARGTQGAAVADVNTRAMSTAMGTMVQYLHAATPLPVQGQAQPSAAFTSANATDVTFYAYVNLNSTAAQPVKVRFYLDANGMLDEQQWASTCNATTGYCTFSSTVSKQFTLGGPVASKTIDSTPTNPIPLFQYYTAPQPATALTTPVTTSLGSIKYVGINLDWGSTTAGAPGNGHADTIVGLLNLGQAGAS